MLSASYHTGFAPRDGYPAYPELWRGCVGAWAPCLGPTGLTLRDWSGRQNHGTLTNMVPGDDWVVSGGRYALDFDGINDRVAVGTLSDFATNSQTISAWINPGSVSNPDKAIVSQIDASGGVGRAFRQTNQQLQWTVASTLTSFRVWATSNTLTTGWQHVALSYNGVNTPTITRNAIQQTVTLVLSSGSPSLPSAQAMSIGYDGGFIQTLYNFLGFIDDVRIYNRELSSNEIRILATRRGIAYEMYRPTYYTPPFSARRRKILTGQV